MPFLDNNVASKLRKKDSFQVGRANVDFDEEIERGIGIPWTSDPVLSWMYFECTVGVMLDSGIVVHNRLPQVDRTSDSLATAFLDDPKLGAATDGVNLRCQDQYQDIVQRMGHARYWFRIWGQALRMGHRVPIPGLRTVGGVPAVPYDRNPQWGYNAIAANYGGVILWRAGWSLWYTTAAPPFNDSVPEADPYARVSGSTKPPKEMQAPYSGADDAALAALPTFVKR